MLDFKTYEFKGKWLEKTALISGINVIQRLLNLSFFFGSKI